MKGTILQISAFVLFGLFFTGCVATKKVMITDLDKGTIGKVVTAKKDQKMFYAGQMKYVVKKGEQLKILNIKPCKSDVTLKCWKLEHPQHGAGYTKVKESWLQ